MAWDDFLFGGLAAGSAPSAENPFRREIGMGIDQGQQMAMSRLAPQLAGGPQDQFRQGQMGQVQQLQGIASGQQQGAGELAAQRQVQNALAAQQAMARGARGGNAGLAMRNAATNAAGLGLAGAGQAQQAALQDQQSAQGLLAQSLGQGRGQDIGLAGQNAQLQAGTQQLNDQLYQNMLQQLQGLGRDEQMARMGAWQANKAAPGLIGPLLSAGGQIGAAAALKSDERLKTDIDDAYDDVDEMLDNLVAKRYRYQNEARDGIGPRVGIMAQDMERSRMGRDVVFEHPDGKALDVNKALSAALASAARLNERVRKLERTG
jgi:hypothetical protein